MDRAFYRKQLNDILSFFEQNYISSDSLLCQEQTRALPPSYKKDPLPSAPQRAASPAVRPYEPSPPTKERTDQGIQAPLPTKLPPANAEVVFEKIAPAARGKDLSTQEVLGKIRKTFSYMEIEETPPSDEIGRLKANLWREELKPVDVFLFHFAEDQESDGLMQNLSAAITRDLLPCKIWKVALWEKKFSWETFFHLYHPKLIISSPALLRHGSLLKFYRENLSSSEKFLSQCPLLLTAPLTTYLTSPEQKKTLWKDLCLMLKKN